jgi:hypothetical protein
VEITDPKKVYCKQKVMISAVIENSQEQCSGYPLTSPLLNTRRMKTDLQTSDNVFLVRSRSGSPHLPSKKSHTIKQSDGSNNKRTIGNTATIR